MMVDDQTVIAFLAEKYAGPVATRALWLWAGGDANVAVYEGEPEEIWGQLWDLAGDGAGFYQLALVREALYDNPGQPVLMEYLQSVAVESDLAAGQVFTALAVACEEAALEAFLPVLLATLPDQAAEPLFPALAVAVHQNLPHAIRNGLEPLLPKYDPGTAGVAPLAKGLLFALRFIPRWLDLPPDHPYHAIVRNLVLLLKPMEKQAEADTDLEAATGDDPIDPVREAIDRMRPHVDQLQTLTVENNAALFTAATAGCQQAFLYLERIVCSDGLPVPDTTARAILQAFWATLPKPD